MNESDALKAGLEMANRASPFHRITGFPITDVEPGRAEIAFEARPELLNHVGALHAGVQCAALDTAAGYAAATLAGPVVTLQMTTQFLASAKGEQFLARASVTKAGKAQLFVDAQLFGRRDGEERLVACAMAVLTKPA